MSSSQESKQYPERSHPAHPTPIERHNEPIIIFVTICIKPRGMLINNNTFHDTFISESNDADQWVVGRYVIMPDHIHLFCSPATRETCSVKRWATYLKKQITRGYPHRDWKWQSDCWDTQMRSREHYEQKWQYIRDNPVRAGLVSDPDDWPWQGQIHQLRW